MKLEFSRWIFENYSPNFMKMHPVGAELFHADRHTDGHTDMTNPIGAFAILLKRLMYIGRPFFGFYICFTPVESLNLLQCYKAEVYRPLN